MVSGHGVKWAIELGHRDKFHTHYCDMSSACKVRRGKSEVLVGGGRSKPVSGGLWAGITRGARHGAVLRVPKFSLHTILRSGHHPPAQHRGRPSQEVAAGLLLPCCETPVGPGSSPPCAHPQGC